MLTATDQKPQKSLKRSYYSASRWHSGNVMVGNITFLMIFAVFDASPLTLWIKCSFSINSMYILFFNWFYRHLIYTPKWPCNAVRFAVDVLKATGVSYILLESRSIFLTRWQQWLVCAVRAAAVAASMTATGCCECSVCLCSSLNSAMSSTAVLYQWVTTTATFMPVSYFLFILSCDNH